MILSDDEPTCKSLAEEKGYTLVENEEDFIKALQNKAKKIAISGTVSVSSSQVLSNVTIEDASEVVGGLCQNSGLLIVNGDLTVAGPVAIKSVDTSLARVISPLPSAINLEPNNKNIYIKELYISQGSLTLTSLGIIRIIQETLSGIFIRATLIV